MAKKREEVASRSPAVTPRRPLSENNPKIPSSTPDKNGPAICTTPVKPPTVVKTTEHVAGTPKTVFYEKFAKQASLQQKECFIELNDSKNALKPTPKKRNIDEKGLTNLEKVVGDEPKLKKALKDEVVNADSPSVKVCKFSIHVNCNQNSFIIYHSGYIHEMQFFGGGVGFPNSVLWERRMLNSEIEGYPGILMYEFRIFMLKVSFIFLN